MVRFCPHCSAENAEDAVSCRECSRALPGAPERRTRTRLPPAPLPGQRASRPSSPPPVPAAAPPRPAAPEPARTARHELPRPVRPAEPRTPPTWPLTSRAPSQTGDGTESSLAPPPTRVGALPPGAGGPPLPLPVVDPMPEAPDGGILAAVRYTLGFLRGLLQRRAAVRSLHEQIKVDTGSLDGVLGELGRAARALELDNRALHGENQAIDAAEKRREQAVAESEEIARRIGEENQRFGEIERERENKITEAEAALEKAEEELSALEAQRRALRDKRKQVERQQRAYVKAAEEREEEAGKLPMGDARAQVRRAAEDMRREAAALDPDRQDIERRLGALEKPVSQAAARVEGLRGELDEARRALNDAREGHRQRRAELEAEQAHKAREVSQAEAEVTRRLVTLGTLLNLNRIERPEFDELYGRIDMLRQAIGARTAQIDRLNSEREGVDRAALARGALVLGLVLVALITAGVVLFAMLR